MEGSSEASVGVRLLRRLALGVLMPTVALSLYLALVHRGGPPSALIDYLALAGSIVLGLIFIWWLLEPFASRTMWCVALSGPLTLWLGFYAWAFLCVLFHDCGPS